jgi:hypothetical protein
MVVEGVEWIASLMNYLTPIAPSFGISHGTCWNE